MVRRQLQGLAKLIGARLKTREMTLDAEPLIWMDGADPDWLYLDRLDESDSNQVFRTSQ
jgi:hypothetical protein